MGECVYLDYSATAPVHPDALAAVQAALSTVGNPSSVHGAGRSARRRLEAARGQVAALIGARAQDIVFTSGASEATSAVFHAEKARPRIVSAIEHDCVRAAAGEQAYILPVDRRGVVDLEALDRLLTDLEAPLVAVMAVNNETGVIQPVAEIGAKVRAASGLFLVDAVQAAGKIPIDVAAWQADYLTLSAHKIGGPQGAGALWLRPGLDPAPLILGGGQERRRRAGTEAVALHAGFGAAAVAAVQALDGQGAFSDWRDRLEATLKAAVPDAVFWSAEAPRVGTVSTIGLPGLPAETQVMRLDLAGFAVSAGSACSSGKVTASPVLQAMGADTRQAGEAIRVSFGWATEPEDLSRFADAWIAMARSRTGMAA